MKILVTGGAGFIGSHTVDRLLSLGHTVSVLDNFSSGKVSNLSSSLRKYNGTKLNVIDKNILDDLESIFLSKFDIVFHFAAQMNVRNSISDPVNDAKINILGSLNIVKNCVKYNVKKLIFSSSGGCVYGNSDLVPTPANTKLSPICPYGISKVAVENYLNFFRGHYSLDINILRYANVYGPRQDPNSEAGVVSIFIEKMINNENPTIYGDGNQTRDFIYIDDVVNANINILENSTKNLTLNIGTGKESTINTLFDNINHLFNNKFSKSYLEYRPGEIKRSTLEISHTMTCLNWKPDVYLIDGLQKTLDYLKNND